MSPSNKNAPLLEVILEGLKIARELLDSGLVDGAKSIISSMQDGIESEFTAEALEARLQASRDTITAKRESVDERIRRVEERQQREAAEDTGKATPVDDGESTGTSEET